MLSEKVRFLIPPLSFDSSTYALTLMETYAENKPPKNPERSQQLFVVGHVLTTLCDGSTNEV